MPEGGRLNPGDTVNAPTILIPGQEEDDPDTPADERLLRKEPGFFTNPGGPDTDFDKDGTPDSADPEPQNPNVPTASENPPSPSPDSGDSLSDWQPGEPLPENEQARIDSAKFERYSMDPNNANNGGKWQAFKQLGYDVQTPEGRSQGAQDVIAQLRGKLPNEPATEAKSTSFGRRFEVRADITGPNGRTGTLNTIWQYDSGSNVPRLITNWLQVHP